LEDVGGLNDLTQSHGKRLFLQLNNLVESCIILRRSTG